MLEANEFMRSLDERADVRAVFEQRGYDLHLEMLRARKRAGLTQEEVAERMTTDKSVISRLESAKTRTMPSMRTLARYAAATGHRVRLVLEPVDEQAQKRAL